MFSKGRTTPKLITWLICAALVFTMIPFSAVGDAQAAEKEPVALAINKSWTDVGTGESLQFYIHGVTDASDKGAENDVYKIKVKGVTEASPLNVYVGGNKISTTVSGVSYTAGTENDGNGVISVSQEWANKQTSWIAISLGDEAVLTDSQKTEIKTAISDNVPSNLEYTGNPQNLLTSAYQQKGWNITYSLEENGVFSDDIPQGTNAGEYDVYFRATKNGYETYADSIKVNIAQQEIYKGLSFAEETQNIGEYNTESRQGEIQDVTIINDQFLDNENISYRLKAGSDNTAGVEVNAAAKTFTYKSPGEATIEAFMSSGNYAATAEYKVVIDPITVNDLEFGQTDDITFNKNNTFVYKATSESTSGVAVKYTLTDAGKTGATIAKDGTVTYKNPGTIKVSAKPASPYSGEEATYEVEVKYAEPDNITISSNGANNVKENGEWFSNGTFNISGSGYQIIKSSDEGNTPVLDIAQGASTWPDTLVTEAGKTDIDEDYLVAFQDENGNLSDWINVNGKNNTDGESDTSWKFATDTYAPTVSFSHGAENMEEAAAILNETPYGYFFKKKVEVTITSNDTPGNGPTGVEGGTITYRLVNADGTSDEGWQTKETDDNKITVTINKGFKGQIEAYATDALGNTLGENEAKHPNGIIWEDEAKHMETSSVQFAVPESEDDKTQVKGFEGYTYPNATRDTNGNGALESAGYEDFGGKGDTVNLYSQKDSPISFDICVQDTYSGIAKVRWTVLETDADKTAASTTFDHTLTVNTPGVIYSDNEEVAKEPNIPDDLLTGDVQGWTATQEDGLVTELILEDFEVSGEANDMVLLVELTDNSGNASYDYYAFGIDNEKPVVEAEYDPASGDEDNNGYFNKNRTVTITVYDRNFDPDDAADTTVQVTRDNRAYNVGAVKWTAMNTKGGAGNDEDGYQTNITFREDGDYTFDIKVRDRAENENDTVNYAADNKATTKFTIDKTKPAISVRYDNNSAANGKYFNRVRTATVTVREHNFDVSRVTFDISATLDGANIRQPSVRWTNRGDTHTATIAYRADGDYEFDVTVEDMAGNMDSGISYVRGTVAGREFTIDTNINEPVITGVEDGSSYRDTVIPVITLDDVNYDSHNIVLLRTRKDEQNVNVTREYIGGMARDSHGGTITCDTFEEIQENDGIYQLTVSMTDMAGNHSEKSITFTVNRFGSVYDYNAYLSSLQDQYVQAVTRNVVITEYNPDRLVEGSLELEITKDGTPLKNPEYSVTPVINSSAPIGSSGWYQYEYEIEASNFSKDGVYRITVASEDEAGNEPETSNYEELDAIFRVDSVAPEFTSIKGLEKAVVNAERQNVSFDVFDAIGLDKITVYVDGKKVKSIDEFEDLSSCSDNFTINSGLKQDVRLVAEDRAGNITDTSSEEFQPAYEFNDTITVSTNIFVRWFANTWLFVGSLAAMAAAAAGIIAFLKRRKGSEDDPDEL